MLLDANKKQKQLSYFATCITCKDKNSFSKQGTEYKYNFSIETQISY